MLPLSRRIAVSANVVFSLYPTRNKVYLILSYLILTQCQFQRYFEPTLHWIIACKPVNLNANIYT